MRRRSRPRVTANCAELPMERTRNDRSGMASLETRAGRGERGGSNTKPITRYIYTPLRMKALEM